MTARPFSFLILKPLDIRPTILRDVRQQACSSRDSLRGRLIRRAVLQTRLRQIADRTVFPSGRFPPSLGSFGDFNRPRTSPVCLRQLAGEVAFDNSLRDSQDTIAANTESRATEVDDAVHLGEPS